MKRTLSIMAIAVAAMFCSCNNMQQQVDNMKHTIDSLQQVNDLKDSSMGLLAETMADIQSNINVIKEHEGIINVALQQEGSSQSQIQSDLDAIKNAMEANKKKVANLQAQLSKSTKNNKELEGIISVLNTQIEQQNAEIQKLNDMLEEKDIEIGFLNNSVIRLVSTVDSIADKKADVDQKLADATDNLETVYYILADKKKLTELGIITSAGLFAGKKTTGDFDNKYFTAANIKELKSLQLNTKRAKLVGERPESSYTLDEDEEGFITLNIKNSDDFWKSSKYLVVIVR
ncbi:MAG: hypothetical protein MJZ01_05115 [Bacteroidales bacterium]|nr:hypothetical protein [Bacteroidales bacterium]